MTTSKTLATLTDTDVRESRTITIIRNGQPVIAGRLLGTNVTAGRVELDLDVCGLRVFVEPLAGETACEVGA